MSQKRYSIHVLRLYINLGAGFFVFTLDEKVLNNFVLVKITNHSHPITITETKLEKARAICTDFVTPCIRSTSFDGTIN